MFYSLCKKSILRKKPLLPIEKFPSHVYYCNPAKVGLYNQLTVCHLHGIGLTCLMEGREGGVLIPFPRKLSFSNPSSNPTIPTCVAQSEIPFPFFYCYFFHESQSQYTKSHLPASKKGKSQLPFYPVTTLLMMTEIP